MTSKSMTKRNKGYVGLVPKYAMVDETEWGNPQWEALHLNCPPVIDSWNVGSMERPGSGTWLSPPVPESRCTSPTRYSDKLVEVWGCLCGAGL